MSYPAFTSLFADPERTMARICVFMALQPPFLSHETPRDAKLEAVRSAARVSPNAIVDALKWLERRGYIRVHSRDYRGVPSVTLAWSVEGTTTASDMVRTAESGGAAHTPE